MCCVGGRLNLSSDVEYGEFEVLCVCFWGVGVCECQRVSEGVRECAHFVFDGFDIETYCWNGFDDFS